MGAGLALDHAWGDWWLNLNGMFFYLGQTNMLEPLEANNVWAASACLAYRWTEAFNLQLQLNGATALYSDTGLSGLDDGMLQVLLGAGYRTESGHGFRLALAEDLIHHTSPDFSVSLEWSLYF